MRSSLAQYEGSHLMCCGRIRYWIDHVESGIRQVTVGNPVFKALNPLKKFDELEVLAREDHVNLFIPIDYLASYDTKFCILENISFHGIVSEYTRSNGTVDYCINSTPQNEILRKFEKVRAQIVSVYSMPDLSSPALIQNFLLPFIDELKGEINQLGDGLPTFTMCRTQILFELDLISIAAERILCVRSSRQFRRKLAQKCKKHSHRLPFAVGSSSIKRR